MLDLRSTKLLKGLSDGEIKKIERSLKVVQHQAGHEIIVRGDGGVGFMIITDGTVTVTTVQGKTRKLGPGDSFGEMALLDHEGRSASVKADTDVSLATMPEWGFKSFLEEHPEVAYRLLQLLSQRVRQAESPG
jgi:CRP-like cAMP-binding protein